MGPGCARLAAKHGNHLESRSCSVGGGDSYAALRPGSGGGSTAASRCSPGGIATHAASPAGVASATVTIGVIAPAIVDAAPSAGRSRAAPGRRPRASAPARPRRILPRSVLGLRPGLGFRRWAKRLGVPLWFGVERGPGHWWDAGARPGDRGRLSWRFENGHIRRRTDHHGDDQQRVERRRRDVYVDAFRPGSGILVHARRPSRLVHTPRGRMARRRGRRTGRTDDHG